jgi:hypothetical protein
MSDPEEKKFWVVLECAKEMQPGSSLASVSSEFLRDCGRLGKSHPDTVIDMTVIVGEENLASFLRGEGVGGEAF